MQKAQSLLLWSFLVLGLLTVYAFYWEFEGPVEYAREASPLRNMTHSWRFYQSTAFPLLFVEEKHNAFAIRMTPGTIWIRDDANRMSVLVSRRNLHVNKHPDGSTFNVSACSDTYSNEQISLLENGVSVKRGKRQEDKIVPPLIAIMRRNTEENGWVYPISRRDHVKEYHVLDNKRQQGGGGDDESTVAKLYFDAEAALWAIQNKRVYDHDVDAFEDVEQLARDRHRVALMVTGHLMLNEQYPWFTALCVFLLAGVFTLTAFSLTCYARRTFW